MLGMAQHAAGAAANIAGAAASAASKVVPQKEEEPEAAQKAGTEDGNASPAAPDANAQNAQSDAKLEVKKSSLPGAICDLAGKTSGVSKAAVGAATDLGLKAKDAAVSSDTAELAAAASKAALGTAVEMGAKAKDAAGTAAGTAAEMGAKAKDAASQQLAEQKQKMTNMAKHLREVVETWVKQKLQKQVERAVDMLPGFAKKSLEDPEMPRFVSRGKDRLIDGMWPDVRAELLWELAVLLDKEDPTPDSDSPGCDPCRAFFRYHMFPYDKSFWGKTRDPWNILFLLIPLVPIFGITPLWFAFVFLMIDKSDEFQLCQFILGFKGTAFVSQGLIRALLGYLLFINCVTAPANEDDHVCELSGPGTTGSLWLDFSALLVMLVLIWAAFVLLRCSRSKGRSTLKGHVAHHDQGASGVKGGYLSFFLWYDLAAFALCAGVVAFVATTRAEFTGEDWVLQHALYGASVLYGFLSMPFFLFTLPVLNRLLTHALPTAYDHKGRCRKPIPPPSQVNARTPKADDVTESEMSDLVTKIKGVLPMPI